MVLPIEKSKFIKDMIKFAQNGATSTDLQKELHKLLMKDTKEGKLYKYRSFDKRGYALKNLRKGTLHCSKVDVFNDPFDCKIGVDFHSLYTAKYETEMDMICGILEKCFRIMRNEISIEDCSDIEKGVIGELLECKRLNDFIASVDKKDWSQEEATMYLFANAKVVEEILLIMISNEYFSKTLGICAKMLPEFMKRISPEGILLLTNENADLEGFARANGVTDDLDEIGLTMNLSRKLYPQNEKALEDVENLIRNKEHQILDKVKSLFLVGCLCTDYKNRLMWSHYADSHSGFCIEYDYSEMEETTLSVLPFPVVYSERRPLVPWKAAIDNSHENVEEAYGELVMALLTKDKIWEYENEWRVLINTDSNAELKMPNISCIYLGVNIEENNRNKIIAIAKKNGISVKQMKLDRGAFDLHAEDVC